LENLCAGHVAGRIALQAWVIWDGIKSDFALGGSLFARIDIGGAFLACENAG
jgi:hypothetical protein